MADGIKTLIESGIAIEDVSKMASINPATSLGIEKTTGSIAEGKTADIAVLDDEYNVIYTFIDGECVYKNDGGEKA